MGCSTVRPPSLGKSHFEVFHPKVQLPLLDHLPTSFLLSVWSLLIFSKMYSLILFSFPILFGHCWYFLRFNLHFLFCTSLHGIVLPYVVVIKPVTTFFIEFVCFSITILVIFHSPSHRNNKTDTFAVNDDIYISCL